MRHELFEVNCLYLGRLQLKCISDKGLAPLDVESWRDIHYVQTAAVEVYLGARTFGSDQWGINCLRAFIPAS